MSSFAFLDEVLVRKSGSYYTCVFFREKLIDQNTSHIFYSDFLSKKTEIQTLQMKIEELHLNNEHSLRLKDMDHRNRIRIITVENDNLVQAEKERFNRLSGDKIDVEESFNEHMLREVR